MFSYCYAVVALSSILNLYLLESNLISSSAEIVKHNNSVCLSFVGD